MFGTTGISSRTLVLLARRLDRGTALRIHNKQLLREDVCRIVKLLLCLVDAEEPLSGRCYK